METQIQQYLEYLEIERGYSTGTIEGYRGYLARFLKWMVDTHPEIRDFTQLNLDHVRGYRMFLARLRAPSGDLLKKVTQAYYIIALRALLRYLIVQRQSLVPVSYTHLRAHETRHDLVCRLLLEKKKGERRILRRGQDS